MLFLYQAQSRHASNIPPLSSVFVVGLLWMQPMLNHFVVALGTRERYFWIICIHRALRNSSRESLALKYHQHKAGPSWKPLGSELCAGHNFWEPHKFLTGCKLWMWTGFLFSSNSLTREVLLGWWTAYLGWKFHYQEALVIQIYAQHPINLRLKRGKTKIYDDWAKLERRQGYSSRLILVL